MIYLKVLEKQQAKPKVTRWTEAIKVRVEVNEMGAKRTIQRIKETEWVL
jgi:hypothetical protein